MIALTAVTALTAILSTVCAALARAVVAWLPHSGFVLGRHGDLVFSPTAVCDGLVLIAAALTTGAAALAVRDRRRSRRPTHPRPALPRLERRIVPDRGNGNSWRRSMFASRYSATAHSWP